MSAVIRADSRQCRNGVTVAAKRSCGAARGTVRYHAGADPDRRTRDVHGTTERADCPAGGTLCPGLRTLAGVGSPPNPAEARRRRPCRCRLRPRARRRHPNPALHRPLARRSSPDPSLQLPSQRLHPINPLRQPPDRRAHRAEPPRRAPRRRSWWPDGRRMRIPVASPRPALADAGLARNDVFLSHTASERGTRRMAPAGRRHPQGTELRRESGGWHGPGPRHGILISAVSRPAGSLRPG